ncbi:MAG: ABC transporter ATP-binding protein/permease [Desulfobacterales bacterium]|nr:ABC transporter ATP-binding protein/permease [Desulfobacterales bacterium]
MKNFHRPFAETFKTFLPLKQYFVRNWQALAIGLLSLLIVDFLQLLIPLIIKRAFDLLTTKTAEIEVLLELGTAILVIALMIAFFRYVWRHLILGHSRRVEEGLRNRIYSHLQTLSPSFYQRTKTGDLMAKAINDINGVRMATGMGLVALVDGLVLGTAAIGFMMSISLKLTLISLIPAPDIVLLTKILTRRMSAGFESVQNTFSDLTEQIREAFAGIRVIKAYNREEWEYQRVRTLGRKYISENMHLARTLGFFFPMMAVFTNIGLAILIWLGGQLTILGDITPGDFVAFISYLNLLTWPMMAMGWVTNLIQRGSASMRRINRILDEVPEIKDTSQPRFMPGIRGEISVKGLSIRYPGKKDDALKDVRMEMEAGETVAVVGPVGSGKTTLLNAIPRLLDVPAGTLFVDGRDIREIPLKTLRKNIGFVTQDVFIFSDTLRNNVLFGRPNVPEEDLEAALRAANIFEDIQEFENGLDTLLGERGITLSGGQRQRLTIARALISDPPILILDDALSMVDTRTEERILNRILGLRRQKTNLIVSHRVSTVSRTDRTVVFEQGEIVEIGNHKSLLKQRGLYASLYEKQILEQELE